MSRKLLCVLAHPDDESFGPGGTLAKYASAGVKVRLLIATKGERGESALKDKGRVLKIERIREKEAKEAAEVLGIEKVKFLGFRDGEISNSIYHRLADKIAAEIKNFAPQVIITHDRLGVSGHLDHIGVSMITTYAFLTTKIANKLYYHCLRKKETPQRFTSKYFVYFPQGYDDSQITTIIDIKDFWKTKVKAMRKHKSQAKDVQRIYKRQLLYPKKEYFILGHWQGIKPKLPESDLFDSLL